VTSTEQEATVVKIPYTAAHTTLQNAELVWPAEGNKRAFEPAETFCPSANCTVLTQDHTRLCGDGLIPPSASSPVASPSSSKPVGVDQHLKLSTEPSHVGSCSSDAAAGVSDMSGTLATVSSGHVSCGSDDVFVSSCSANSFSAPSVEPLSSVSGTLVLWCDEQNMPLASNSDCEREFGQMEATETSEMSPLKHPQGSLYGDISCSSSPSESESEPLGGCKDALLNPNHCISDLCLEDNDDDSIFAAAGYQSPVLTDSLDKRNDSPAADPFSVGYSLAFSVASNRIKRDSDNLLDLSELDVLSLSNLNSLQSPLEFACNTSTYNETEMISSGTVNSPFRSPPRSSICDDVHLYSRSVPVDTSSPFRSPPKSSYNILESKLRNKTAAGEALRTTKMSLFESAEMSYGCAASSASAAAAADVVINNEGMISHTSSPDVTSDEPLVQISESVTDGGLLTARDENQLNVVIKKEETVVAGSVDVFECRSPPRVSRCDEYKPYWTSESSVAAVRGNLAKTSADEVACNPPETDVHCPKVEMRFQNGSDLCLDVYCMDTKGRQASVKQLKCKFESEQDLGSRTGERTSPNLTQASIQNTAESVATYRLPRDSTDSASAYKKKLEDPTCSEITDANLDSSNRVQHNHIKHNSECSNPSSVCKSTRVCMRDFKQCRQPSISARISCFEPMMSVSSTGCQKENKRARLSSCGSAVDDPVEVKLNTTSHSMKDCFTDSCQADDGGWFAESPQRGRAKQYQRCSSAGHEDLLALLNIPATAAKHIPRVSERKRMFETETANANNSESAGFAACSSPAFECSPQRLSKMDKENSLHGYEGNCRGQVNSRRSLFEGNSACTVKNDSIYRDSSVDVDCHSFKYPVNRIKTKNRCLQMQ